MSLNLSWDGYLLCGHCTRVIHGSECGFEWELTDYNVHMKVVIIEDVIDEFFVHFFTSTILSYIIISIIPFPTKCLCQDLDL